MKFIILASSMMLTAAVVGAEIRINGNKNHASEGAQTIQYCNMPKEIKVIQQQCAKQKIVYKTKWKTKVIKSKVKVKVVEKVVYKNVYKKNMLRLLGGYGPTGVDSYRQNNVGIAEERKGVVFGIGYSRMLNESFSLGGNALTNKTYLLEAGFHF